jgi:hypothetical protein
MTEVLDNLKKIAEWQHEYIGRQQMQTAVLHWAIAHKDALNAAGLTDGLVAAMDADIVLHSAARPQLVTDHA